MKIKIKYDIKDNESGKIKSYTKSLADINNDASKEDIKKFVSEYLNLYDGLAGKTEFVVSKTNEELITRGNL